MSWTSTQPTTVDGSAGQPSADPCAAAEGAFNAGDLSTAAARFEAIIGGDPTNARARYGLAVTHMRLGNLALAEQLLTEVDGAAPDANVSYQRALIAEHERRYAQAADLLRESLRRNPGHRAAAAELRRLSPSGEASPVPQPAMAVHAAAPVDYVALAQLLDERAVPVPSPDLPGDLLHVRHRSLRSVGGGLLPAVVVGLLLLGLPATSRVIVPGDQGLERAFANVIDLSTRLHHSWLPLSFLTAVVGGLYCLTRCLTTTYLVYERRLDVREGILRRREYALWLYEVHSAPRLTQNPVQLLFDYATVIVESAALPQQTRAARRGHAPAARLVGIGSHAASAALAEELRLRALVERRRMVDRFISR